MTEGISHTRRTTDEEVEIIATRSAKTALTEFFLTMDIDLSTPDGVKSFRSDLRHMHYMRTLSTSLGNKTFAISSRLVIGGLLLWLYLKLGGHIPQGFTIAD